MQDRSSEFERHRPRLFGIAYRMLSSRADAEDVLQDAYLRRHRGASDELRSPEAWLVTTVTRLCIDRLRAVRAEREQYVGPWLPVPLIGEAAPAADAPAELSSSLSIAFLVVLERLSPDERAAFLLREVFDTEYAEIAQILGKSEAACRQMLSRARKRVRESDAGQGRAPGTGLRGSKLDLRWRRRDSSRAQGDSRPRTRGALRAGRVGASYGPARVRNDLRERRAGARDASRR